ncbi:MAG: hypothetical protein A4E49_03282 [Methanosaeta sp. PtaU1.Bin112]|nr:MAG: hypothetical protein A4E49_03282 [Methanosaeta sp. PtaU1.Bin112]
MTWEKKRVLVTVKAYPEKSKKYGEVACTIGLTDEGDWIRLYPIPFNVFSGRDGLKKYDWIEVDCKRAEEKLSRKESYRIRDGSLKITDRSLSLKKVKGRVNWVERNKIILSHISPSIEELRDKFNEDRTSIGLIKPAELLDFYKTDELKIYGDTKSFQQSLFGASIPEIEEIPHLFSYRFRCNGCKEGAEHKIQCEDWELFESYRSWGKRYGDTSLLWEKLYDKYYRLMKDNDLYFFMGTFSQFPTWLIVGLYYPPGNLEQQQRSRNRTLDELQLR